MQVTLAEDRYDRQRLITWWDQERLASSRVLLIGAGALGNEILKNLVLLGVGHVHVIDMDVIEPSNLARCVLFRDSDAGAPKAEVAARVASSLNPHVTVVGERANVLTLGLGFLQGYDLVIAGLDNREARVWINQAARKLGITWVDGAIEGLRGLARVFPPDGPCYECTLGQVDRELLTRRKSCSLLTRDEILAGKTPTTSTTASVIAAVQTQEAIKLLVGRRELVALANRAFVFVGETLESFVIEYSEDPECMAHDRYRDIHEIAYREDLSLHDLVGSMHGEPPTAIEFETDFIRRVSCSKCGRNEEWLRRVVDLPPGSGVCATCGNDLSLDALGLVDPADEVTRLPLRALGIPPLDVITVHSEGGRHHYLLGNSDG